MFKLPKTIFLLSFLLLFFSCGRKYNSTPSVIARSEYQTAGLPSKKDRQQNIFINDPALGRFFVPPEIAIMEVTIYARGDSFSEVSNLINTNSDRVIQGLSQIPGCTANITDYFYPQGLYEKSLIAGEPDFTTRVILEVVISFAGMNNVPERITQLNSCTKEIQSLKTEVSQDKDEKVSINLASAIPTIKDTSIYRKQLLEKKFAKLQEIAALSQTPSQFEASDTKCTSNGNIQIGDRSLSKIELDIDFNCQQFNK